MTGEENWDARMAKKDKEPQAEADGENAEATGEGEAAPKKGLKRFLTKKILMIAVPAPIARNRSACASGSVSPVISCASWSFGKNTST